jgi:hypothetical protein
MKELKITIEDKEEKAFKKFKEFYAKNKNLYKDYCDFDTFYFIEKASEIRGIGVDLHHRLMYDFAKFILMCRNDKEISEDSWLWSNKEFWFWFYKYYKILLKDR